MADNACSASINNCAEANLDVEYLMAISQGTPTTFFYWNSTSDYWVGFLVSLANRRGSSTTPLVISISYGSIETQLSAAYLNSFNIEALKLAAQGVTIIASSGDDGVNCARSLCSSTAPVCGYYPLFPASSPYVTAVGATQVTDIVPYSCKEGVIS
jgi:tripeptidyl-peptidase I